jgi:hypothetical protein
MAFICDIKSNRSNFTYPFNWLVMLNDYLPILRRVPKFFALLSVPFKYIWNFYLQFMNYRCLVLHSTAINGQTIVLEKALNVMFNNNEDGIEIVNTLINFQTLYVYNSFEQPPIGQERYIFNRNEAIPTGATQSYVFRKDEIQFQYDFVVRIPAAIYSIINLNQLRAIIDQYIFVGTNYNVVQY